jgi:hypothetical protein
MFQTVCLQNMENFEYRKCHHFEFQNLGEWKSLEIRNLAGPAYQSQAPPNRLHRSPAHTRATPWTVIICHRCPSPPRGERSPSLFPLYRSRSHLSTPTPISARPASAMPRASLCCPWPPPTLQTAMLECPSNCAAGFTSPGSHAVHRPGHRPPRLPAHASTMLSAFPHQAQLECAAHLCSL